LKVKLFAAQNTYGKVVVSFLAGVVVHSILGEVSYLGVGVEEVHLVLRMVVAAGSSYQEVGDLK
jgi:hypothetical protein